jgi:hypothetical protein
MACERLDKFFIRQTSEMYGESGLPESYRFLHTALVAASVNELQEKAKLRRASMCLDGTPVVYSLKSQRNTALLPLRMLVEPGGLGITVSEQINVSLRLVDEILHRMGWLSVISDLNAVIPRVFPWDASIAEKLWGGIWLGCELSFDEIQFRIYLNLRYGDAHSRWQRFADVLSLFGDSSHATPLKSLIKQVLPYAIPVGLGIALSEKIRAIRLYVGMYDPNYESILKAGIDKLHGSQFDVSVICNSFTNAFGPFVQQSVTLGYDFILKSGRLVSPKIKRTKLDISCQLIKKDNLHLLIPLITDLLLEWDLDNKQLNNFLKDMIECFGGFDIEFLSFGFVERLEHITVYAKPKGYNQA